MPFAMATGREKQLVRARALTAQRRYEDALVVYRGLCSADPYDPAIWLERAAVSEAGGIIEDAITSYYYVGELYTQAGIGEAVEMAERVLKLAPRHRGALRILRVHGVQPPATADRSDAIPEVIHDQDVELSLAVAGAGQTNTGHLASEPIIGHANHGAHASQATPTPPLNTSAKWGSNHIPIAESIPVPAPVSPSTAFPIPRETTQSIFEELSWSSSGGPELYSLPEQEKVNKWLKTVGNSTLCQGLESDDVARLTSDAKLLEPRKGQRLFRTGETGTSLYVILTGGVDVERYHPVLKTDVRLSTLSSGAFFGELSLISGAPRASTCSARRGTTLLEISRSTVAAVCRRNQQLLLTLMRFFRARLVGTLLATSALFHPLSADERRNLITRFRVGELAAGDTVFDEGGMVDGLYVVLVGTLAAYVSESGGDSHQIARIGSGGIFGEESLLDGRPANEQVKALTRSWILRLPRSDFDEIAAAHPEVLECIAELADTRSEK